MVRDEVRFYLTSRIRAKLTSMVSQYAELSALAINKLDASRRLKELNLLPLLGLVSFTPEGKLADPSCGQPYSAGTGPSEWLGAITADAGRRSGRAIV